MKIANVSKGIAGAVAGAAIGNGTLVAMTPDQLAQTPWWGILLANVAYAAIGFATVWLAPKNAS